MSDDYRLSDFSGDPDPRAALTEKYPQLSSSYRFDPGDHSAAYNADLDQLNSALTRPDDGFSSGAEVEWVCDLITELRPGFAFPADALALIEAGLPRAGGKPIPRGGHQTALAGAFGDAIRYAIGDCPGGRELVFLSYMVPQFQHDLGNGESGATTQMSWPVLPGVEVGQLVQQLAKQYAGNCIGCFWANPNAPSEGQPEVWSVAAKAVAVVRRGSLYVALPLCKRCVDGLRCDDPAIRFVQAPGAPCGPA